MPAVLFRFLGDEEGATAIEYGIIAALLGAGLIVAFTLFGNSLVGLFGYVRDNATDAMAG
ncbi:MAG TPA: Flp family type IVb pilin [Devosia sp.]|jgi:pilus assembly protein Flp/PilA|nr:Flp family type IVb pilin [Devosia sp.]